MNNMFFYCFAVYQDVVEEYQNTLSQEGKKCGVHCPLEGVRCAGETKSHHSELKMTPMCLEGCLDPELV